MSARRLAGAATLFASAALVLYWAPGVSSYAEGAPAGFSGGFGEPSCHACHFDADPNAGPGRAAIEGVPDRFAPGRQYRLTVSLTQPDMELGGFQLTARFEDDGAQAGDLAPAPGEEARVGVDVLGTVQYVSQRREGTSVGAAGTAAWKLMWTAPPGDAPVVFHVAANAADGDETTEGDYVHTLAVRSAPGSAGSR